MRFLLALLALGGIVVSVLALQIHYSTDTPPCAINERWDCGVVNRGPFSTVGPVAELAFPSIYKSIVRYWPFSQLSGLPVAAMGIAGYLALAVLALFRRRVLTLGAALAGCAIALDLTYIEKYVLETWCLYCVISQCLIATIVLLSIPWAAVHLLAQRKLKAGGQ
jgi:uncharacterized membrane protein